MLTVQYSPIVELGIDVDIMMLFFLDSSCEGRLKCIVCFRSSANKFVSILEKRKILIDAWDKAKKSKSCSCLFLLHVSFTDWYTPEISRHRYRTWWLTKNVSPLKYGYFGYSCSFSGMSLRICIRMHWGSPTSPRTWMPSWRKPVGC